MHMNGTQWYDSHLGDKATRCPDVLRGLLMVVDLGLPLLNRLFGESQQDPLLIHQSCTDATCSNINAHVVVAWLLVSSRHHGPWPAVNKCKHYVQTERPTRVAEKHLPIGEKRELNHLNGSRLLLMHLVKDFIGTEQGGQRTAHLTQDIPIPGWESELNNDLNKFRAMRG